MSIRVSVAVLLTLLASVLTAGQSRPSESPRLIKLKEWMALVEQHEPGRIDRAVETVRAWERQWLQDVRDDLFALRLLICSMPRLVGGSGRCVVPASDREGNPQLPNHAVMRAAGMNQWVGFYPRSHMDALLSWAASFDRLDVNRLLKHGALLHTNIAFRAPPAPMPSRSSVPLFLQSFAINVADGRESGVNQSIDHLEMARRLLDLVTPDPRRDTHTYPERDGMVRDWYRATLAVTLHERRINNRHTIAGVELFAEDDEVLFLGGAVHETLGSPQFQLGVETRSIGKVPFVESERAELSRAEELFRRALKANPGHAEARMRLGQVLARRGRTAEALAELRTASDASTDPLVSYDAALLLGREETDLERAREAFQRAASLYPRAQSPRIGLSEVEMRSGNPQAAARILETVLARGQSASRDDDPWSSYFTSAGRAGLARLASMTAAFLPSQRQ